MDNEEFDTKRNGKGQWTWVYHSPAGAEYLGATWHRTRKEALAAGQAWLEARRSR